MSFLVQKFGGTSVAHPERIRSVANRIKKSYEEGTQLVVVVSAMGDTTDELHALALQVSRHPPIREWDMLVSAGERISMALLSMALSDLGIPAVSFTGSQTGIITCDSHRRARIKKISAERVRKALAEKKVVIVAGFQGVSESKEITTLGRGGSDTTAVALATTLHADACEIFTDVDGVFSADPRKVPRARLLKTVSYGTMLELANLGAQVLHPRSVALAKKHQVCLKVLNSLKPSQDSQGTEIMNHKELESSQVLAVTANPDRMLLTVGLDRPATVAALWQEISKKRFSFMSPIFHFPTVQGFIEREDEEQWKKALTQLLTDGFIKEFSFSPELSPISMVGECFPDDGSMLHLMIESLAQDQISVSIGMSSALSVTAAVPSSRLDDGIQILHRDFVEKTNE